MAKSNAFTVAKLKSLPAGKHCDGQGLWFHKRADGGAQSVFRFQLWGRQREMGLGSFKHVSLAEARRKADWARQQVQSDIDPVKQPIALAAEPSRSLPTRARQRSSAP